MLEKWAPLSLPEVQSLFAHFGVPWWIAGGIAIELAVGRRVREHRDIDVLILRRDQERLRAILKGWNLCAADSERDALRPWRDGEILNAPINALWCRRGANCPWELEVLLDEACEQVWVSRRCSAVSRSVSSLGWLTANAIPVLAPEIQLFYKAKNSRPEDECDFSAMLPNLTAAQSLWLDDALTILFPTHPWRRRLRLLMADTVLANRRLLE